jgi:FtsP/CotA-like multicopper oxidase with cupredoxin domain
MTGMPGHNMGGTPPPAGQSGGGGGNQGHGGTQTAPPANQHQGHQGMPGMGAVSTAAMAHGPDTHGPGNSMVPMMVKNRLGEPGTGLESAGHKVLVYTDLMNVEPFFDQRPPTRDIELHLTGSMERFMWSINGKKFSEDPTPIPLKYGERVRLIMVNDTMMEHPMHLHGMWMILENGHGAHQPRKHTIIVKPAERMSVLVTADAVGPWAYHCHQLFHMEVGMFRVFEVRP